MACRLALLLAAAGAVLVAAAPASFAQAPVAQGPHTQGPCAAVAADGNPEVGYKRRGDRCEGLFNRPVAAAVNLTVIGAHLNQPAFSASASEAVAVRVPAAGPAGPLNLRIVSAKVRQYYRLDASVGASRLFNWPADVRAHPLVQLAPADVRAVACSGSCDSATPTIVPLVIGKGAPMAAGIVKVTLTAAVDLAQLNVSVMAEGAAKNLHDNVDVMSGRSMQLANTAIDIDLPLPPGSYRIKVTAVPASRLAGLDSLRFKLIVPSK